MVLVDEILTPDSSRFWPASGYKVGEAQASFDKQYLRDWLVSQSLKGREGVSMPEDVVQNTEAKYREAFERLVGKRWEDVVANRCFYSHDDLKHPQPYIHRSPAFP